MKYISVIVICLICKTSFSQFKWDVTPLYRARPAYAYDSSVSKKIVIMYTTNDKRKVLTTAYMRGESTSTDEMLIRDAKLKTLMAKPVIITRDGLRYTGTYTFIFSLEGKLLFYFQDRPDGMLIGSFFISRSTTPYS